MSASLVERESELVQVHQAIAAAKAGDGRMWLVEGPPGIGKTTLMDVIRGEADEAGLVVLSARGFEHEGGFSFGLVRELFEATLRAASPERRERMLSGAAARAGRVVLGLGPDVADPGERVVLGLGSDVSDPADQMSAVAYGLYWLVANLAADGPLAVLVDDAHWSDPPSLRFLAYLAGRIEDLPVMVVASFRSGDPSTDPTAVAELRESLAVRRSNLAPLSRDGVARLLADEFGRKPDDEFVRSCHAVTGGNPFFVRELATELRGEGVVPSSSAAGLIEQAGPEAVARRTLLRLHRVSARAAEFARMVSVLGADAQLPLAAALAGLNEIEAAEILGALVEAEVIAVGGSGEGTLIQFSHPIVRRAIYEDFPIGARSAAHRRAAALLRAAGADIDIVARHLFLTEPVGSMDTVAVLREAAHFALAAGAPDGATTYLTRALAENPDRDLRASLLYDLGRAELLAGLPAGLDHLEEVARLSRDPMVRVASMIDRARAVYYGDPVVALALLEDSVREIPGEAGALRLRAEVMRALPTMYDPRHVDGFRQRLPGLEEMARRGGPGTRPLLALLGAWHAQHDPDYGQALDLLTRAWDEGRYLDEGDDVEVLPQIIGVQIQWDELEQAAAICEELLGLARRTGSVRFYLLAEAHFTWLAAARGDLDEGAALLRESYELAVESGQDFAAMCTLWYGAETLLERPDLADLADLVESWDLGPIADLQAGVLLIHTRGRLRLASGNREGAVADLRHSLDFHEALGTVQAFVPHRCHLALALEASDRDGAVALAQTDLDLARESGLARRSGVALRTLGLLATDRQAGIAYLEHSVAELAGSPARLEQARSLVELGAARRRQGELVAARGPLQEGLEAAVRCGAHVTAERARTELAASGIRSGEASVSWSEALTPSERRVARMAAEGRASREIAQALFVTTRTVDSHLGRVYAKLGITSRRQLVEALGDAPGDA